MREFDVIVVGAGHAGCEAALASARLGKKTIMFATNLDTVAFLACNPSIGGTAKGQIVREIDALGGQMALNADKSLLQMRMLNRGKGPAVHSPRAQVDKHSYHANMKNTIEQQENLTLRQGEVVSIETAENSFVVKTAVGQHFFGKAVIVCSGVYLNSKTIVGQHTEDSGPNGFQNAKHLSSSLKKLGFVLRRFKTGTPARVKQSSLNFEKMSQQKGEQNSTPFSFLSTEIESTKRSCFLTYTTEKTKQLILQNKHLAPIFNGSIEGAGPRYCPSIEDKVFRFADKERHQIFLEPEGEHFNEFYVQGASSSLPADVQEQVYRSIDGLENVEILRDAYAIEYDCIDATELHLTLMSKKYRGLFFAGQINGTSGYEEAACQGLVAGVNAVRLLKNEQPFILTRNDSYIGVLIDDITTKESFEPYRMMTGRAEHRLVLRQDNADLRLTDIGRQIGLVSDLRYQKFCDKKNQIENAKQILTKVISPKQLNEMFLQFSQPLPQQGLSVADLFRRGFSYKHLQQHLGLFAEFSDEVLEEIEIDTKYQGYIEKQQALIENAQRMEQRLLPTEIDYNSISGLRLEARQKLNKIRPQNLGQASRISGVSPSDIQVLIVYLMQQRENQ